MSRSSQRYGIVTIFLLQKSGTKIQQNSFKCLLKFIWKFNERLTTGNRTRNPNDYTFSVSAVYSHEPIIFLDSFASMEIQFNVLERTSSV